MQCVGIELGAQLGLRLEIGIGQGLLRGTQALPHLVSPCKPQTGGDVQGVFAQRVYLLDHRAQVLQMFCRLRCSGGNFGIHIFSVPQGGRIRHAQSLHTILQACQVVHAVKRQRGPVTGVGQGDGVHHQRNIFHRHGMRAQMCHRAKWRQGVGRHAAKAGLKTHIATKRSGNAHTACAIGAYGQRPQARAHRRRCPAR